MIFMKIGMVLTLFVTMPLLAVVVLYCLIHDDDLEYEEYQTCGTCDECTQDFGVWICDNEDSYYYQRPVDPEDDGCMEWRDDGTWSGLL